MGCMICDRIDLTKRGENPFLVRELETGYVVIGDHQHFRGYSLFLCKEHATELHFLPQPFRGKHLEELALVYEAVYRAFQPDKMNCELLGMGEGGTHIHWHLFPRRDGDIDHRGPVWHMPFEEMYAEDKRPSPEELTELKAALGRELEELLCAYNEVEGS